MAKRSRTSGNSPWPKPEGQRIRIDRQWRDCPEVVLGRPEVVDRRIKETWDDYDSLFYNQWLSVNMQPTRIADRHALTELGIFDEVTRLLERSGLGEFSGNKVSHTDIRHPVLRYVIRLLSNTVLYRNEPGKVRHEELLALYYLISEDITWQSYGDLLRDLNWGAVFADRLLEQKNTPFTLKTSNSFRAGSLITPIMRFCGIDLARYSSIHTPCSMDIRHMVSATWIGGDQQWLIRDDSRKQFQVLLPLPELTDIRSGTDALHFLPDGRRAVVSRRTARRVSASRMGSSSASATAGSSSSARRLAPPPQ
ncbi:hypothetical protein AALP_AAs40697U000100, partial [Arabis alpina]